MRSPREARGHARAALHYKLCSTLKTRTVCMCCGIGCRAACVSVETHGELYTCSAPQSAAERGARRDEQYYTEPYRHPGGYTRAAQSGRAWQLPGPGVRDVCVCVCVGGCAHAISTKVDVRKYL